MKYTYLLINIFAVLIPFLFSFHNKIKFNREWNSFFPALILTGSIFIIWDIYFTDLKVWGFNTEYLTGIFLFNLPVEEILFFLCIPYACVFTYHCFGLFLKINISDKNENVLSTSLITLLLITAILNYTKLYTATTFIVLLTLLLILKFIVKAKWLSKFYITYAVLLIPFLIVNGILTGSGVDHPIVFYNDDENLGIRLLTIPIEDVFYGMVLILLNVSLFEFFKNRIKNNHA
jgi:lycopene cyclase domain-containing protein